MLKTKVYNVWMMLLDHRGRWLDVTEVARCTDLTVRQVLSILTTMDTPYLKREKDSDGATIVRFFMSEAEAETVKRAKTAERFGYTDEHFSKVWNSMSPAGWMTLGEIAEGTGFNNTSVARMLSLMDGVDIKTEGDRKLYIRSI